MSPSAMKQTSWLSGLSATASPRRLGPDLGPWACRRAGTWRARADRRSTRPDLRWRFRSLWRHRRLPAADRRFPGDQPTPEALCLRHPWPQQTSFHPRGLSAWRADRLSDADDIEGGTVKHLFETLGLRQVGYRDWITVRAQDAAGAIFFNLSRDGRVRVFQTYRTTVAQTGTSMKLTVTGLPPAGMSSSLTWETCRQIQSPGKTSPGQPPGSVPSRDSRHG